MEKANVKIHHPDGIHWWGIEYNHNPKYENTSATEFVHGIHQAISQNRSSGSGDLLWFHQCGTHDSYIDERGVLQYPGYQFFEYWSNDQDYLLQIAQTVAEQLGVEVEL